MKQAWRWEHRATKFWSVSKSPRDTGIPSHARVRCQRSILPLVSSQTASSRRSPPRYSLSRITVMTKENEMKALTLGKHAPTTEIASIRSYHSKLVHSLTVADRTLITTGKPLLPHIVDYDLWNIICAFYESGYGSTRDAVVCPTSTWSQFENSSRKSVQHGCTEHPFASTCIAIPIFLGGSHWGLLLILYLADAIEESVCPGDVPRTAFVFFDSMPDLKKAGTVMRSARTLAALLLKTKFVRKGAITGAPFLRPVVSHLYRPRVRQR